MKNEDKDDELLDLVNENDEVVGVVERKIAHNDPTKIYRIVSVTVFNEKGETLIQKRSVGKSHPGKWENSVSGHVKAGEDPIETAKRELSEELGIVAVPIFYNKWFVPGKTKNKFMWMYYVVVPKSTKVLVDENEVEDTLWIRPESLFEFSKDNFWDVNGYSHKEIMEVFNLLHSVKK